MANTFVVSRNHLILGLCLPLAVLLGLLLAEPLDSASLAVIVAVVGILCVPLMMRWHHLLLVLSWNAAIQPVFIKGRPALWMVLAFVSLLFTALSRSVNPNKRLVQVPVLTRSLLLLLGVVVATAPMTAGFGIKAFGSTLF